MGILDNKSRIVDAVITEEGRRQLASGKMKIEYYTFTDGDVFYQSSSVGVTSDASSRFYFEAPSKLPSDQIVLESDDSGKLKFQKSNLNIFNGTMYQVDDTDTGDDQIIGSPQITYLSGSEFSSQIDGILSTSIDNFLNLRIISSQDKLFGEESFDISSNEDHFTLKKYESLKTSIQSLPDMLKNIKSSTSINFQYLPPIYLDKNNNSKNFFGEWVKVSSPKTLDYDYITYGDKSSDELRQTKFAGTIASKKKGFEKIIDFFTSNTASRFVCQVFEISNSNSVTKLDILNAGVFQTDDVDKPKKKVVFLGKVIKDETTQSDKFVSIFTLVLE